MGFELILRRREGAGPLTHEEVGQVMRGIPNIAEPTPSEDCVEYAYENRITVVEFTFAAGAEADESRPEGPVIRFGMEYLRPTFFALEAMPIVTRVARHLDMRIENAQAPEDTPDEPSSDDLVAWWSAGNEKAVKEIPAADDPAEPTRAGPEAYAPRERLDYWWGFMRHRGVIDDEFAREGILVPERVYFTVTPEQDRIAVQSVIWPDCVPMVFPEVDYVVVERRSPGFLGLLPKVERGMLEFARVQEVLGSELAEVTEPIPYYIYRPSELRPDVRESVAALDFLPVETFEALSPQSVVDVEA